MDTRSALQPGSVLRFVNRDGGNVSYRIRGEIGRGGSCIVYDAEYTTNADDTKRIRIKECCPFGLRLERKPDGCLNVHNEDHQAFRQHLDAFKQAFLRNNRIFSNGDAANYVANQIDWYEANGTCYIVSVYLYGKTLAEYKPTDLHETISLCAAAAKAVDRIHKAGFLYLDLKPENIFIIQGTSDLVQLFDFDSLIDRISLGNDVPTAGRISFTRGFAALELQKSQRRKLAPSTDVFSLGAVLFHLLFGHTPNAFDCTNEAEYDWSAMRFPANAYQDKLFSELTSFFHHTIASYQPDRYRSMSETLDELQVIAKYADELQLFIASTQFSKPIICLGRENQISQLQSMIADEPIINVSGMGGIGKSTLVREYISENRAQYDAVLWLYWTGDMITLFADDRRVFINTLRKDPKETKDEYYLRKLGKLRELTANQEILFVFDDFIPTDYNQLSDFLDIGCKTILISRESMPAGSIPALRVEALMMTEAERLLTWWSSSAQELPTYLIRQVAENTDRHTLLLELIGRQVASGKLTLDKAADLTAKHSLSSVYSADVDYIHDKSFIRNQMQAILGELIRYSALSEEEHSVLKILSLFHHAGISQDSFTRFSPFHDWNHLKELGWISAMDGSLSIHPISSDYFNSLEWSDEYVHAAEVFMTRLYQAIHPDRPFPDTDKQFPLFNDPLYDYLEIAEQVVENYHVVSVWKNRLLYHLVMDSPVDREEKCIQWADQLLANPGKLEPNCISKIYSEAALVCQRMDNHLDAERYLNRMRNWLLRHPSGYYWALWHNNIALCSWNEGTAGHERSCLPHWEQAIVLAKMAHHPQAKLLLAECLLHKLTALLDLGAKPRACSKIMFEVIKLEEEHIPRDSYEHYQFWCIASHYFAQLADDEERAFTCMQKASEIAWETRDSDLAWIDHLYDEWFTLCMCMNDWEQAISTLKEAISFCEKHEGVAPYDRKKLHMENCLKSIYEAIEEERINASRSK